MPVHDAHSLYLEAFAELGLVGGLLVLALVGTAALDRLRRLARGAAEPQRELYAALLAAVARLRGRRRVRLVLGDRRARRDLLPRRRRPRRRPLRPARRRRAASATASGEGRRFGLAVAGLALAWITALALVGPLLVDHEIEASQAAAADGDIASAVNHADTARSIEPWAASPYVQLGLLAQLQGDYPAAAERLTQAIDREDRNWLLYYLRSKVEHEAGDERRRRRRPATGRSS